MLTRSLLTVSISGFLLAANVSAETIPLKATLANANEVPPTSGQGHGTLQGTFDTATKTLTWNVDYGGLTGPASMAHFHGPAPTGANAKIQVPIDPGALATPIKGSKVLTDEQSEQLMQGQWYFNVHTKQNPAGEIRGQVVKAQ